MTLEALAWSALGTVRDPELDEAITTLGFVAEITVDGGDVAVALRLPTYFCAPNFAWLMVADARSALARVPGVRHVSVRLTDHFTASEINDGVAAGNGFVDSFAGLADDELDTLRALFRRKAYLSREYRLCRRLLDAGHTREQLAAMRVADLPAGDDTTAYLQRRRELGVDTHPDAPLLIDPVAGPVPAGEVEARLRKSRAVAVSIEGNAGLCRGLLATRYGHVKTEEHV